MDSCVSLSDTTNTFNSQDFSSITLTQSKSRQRSLSQKRQLLSLGHNQEPRAHKGLADLLLAHDYGSRSTVLSQLRALVNKQFRFEDQYFLGDKIANGAFGTVHECTKKSTMETFVVKIMSLKDIDEAGGSSLLIRELTVLKHTSHPNLIKHYDTFISPRNQIFVVLENCEAGSLYEIYCNLGVPFNENQIKFMAHSVLLGLQYLHRMDIIHRDIKASNILLSRIGSVKLADFGSCGVISTNMCQKEFVGTPYWMAPEVIKNCYMPEPYDHKADIWSLGITCIECAECDPPFSFLDPAHVIAVIANCEEELVRLAHPERWSPLFSAFLDRCIKKDPGKRASASALLVDPWFETLDKAAFLVISSLPGQDWLGWSWADSWEDDSEETSETIRKRALLDLASLQEDSEGENRSGEERVDSDSDISDLDCMIKIYPPMEDSGSDSDEHKAGTASPNNKEASSSRKTTTSPSKDRSDGPMTTPFKLITKSGRRTKDETDHSAFRSMSGKHLFSISRSSVSSAAASKTPRPSVPAAPAEGEVAVDEFDNSHESREVQRVVSFTQFTANVSGSDFVRMTEKGRRPAANISGSNAGRPPEAQLPLSSVESQQSLNSEDFGRGRAVSQDERSLQTLRLNALKSSFGIDPNTETGGVGEAGKRKHVDYLIKDHRLVSLEVENLKISLDKDLKKIYQAYKKSLKGQLAQFEGTLAIQEKKIDTKFATLKVNMRFSAPSENTKKLVPVAISKTDPVKDKKLKAEKQKEWKQSQNAKIESPGAAGTKDASIRVPSVPHATTGSISSNEDRFLTRIDLLKRFYNEKCDLIADGHKMLNELEHKVAFQAQDLLKQYLQKLNLLEKKQQDKIYETQQHALRSPSMVQGINSGSSLKMKPSQGERTQRNSLPSPIGLRPILGTIQESDSGPRSGSPKKGTPKDRESQTRPLLDSLKQETKKSDKLADSGKPGSNEPIKPNKQLVAGEADKKPNSKLTDSPKHNKHGDSDKKPNKQLTESAKQNKHVVGGADSPKIPREGGGGSAELLPMAVGRSPPDQSPQKRRESGNTIGSKAAKRLSRALEDADQVFPFGRGRNNSRAAEEALQKFHAIAQEASNSAHSKLVQQFESTYAIVGQLLALKQQRFRITVQEQQKIECSQLQFLETKFGENIKVTQIDRIKDSFDTSIRKIRDETKGDLLSLAVQKQHLLEQTNLSHWLLISTADILSWFKDDDRLRIFTIDTLKLDTRGFPHISGFSTDSSVELPNFPEGKTRS